MPDIPLIINKTQLELEKDINDLNNKLTDQDRIIKTLSNEKTSLINEKNNLLSDLAQQNSEISALKADNLSRINAYEEKLKTLMDAAAQKDLEIANLNSRVIELARQGVSDKTLIADMENLNIKYEILKKETMVKDLELVSKRAETNRLTAEKENLARDYASLKDSYLQEQQEKTRYRQDLDLMNEKLKVSFTADEMSNYFSKAIDSFNKNINSANTSLNYVINEMDVELKTALSRNDTNEMLMTAPNIVNENAFSTVKFSIRAVPKGMSPKK
jgi:chromosome segregation ATPase